MGHSDCFTYEYELKETSAPVAQRAINMLYSIVMSQFFIV